MKRLILVFMLALMGAGSVFASTGSCVQQAGTMVVFGNGIMNSKYDANQSKKQLKDVLKSSLPPDQFSRLEFKVAYNQSYGFLSDLFESLLQKLPQDNAAESFFRWLSGQGNVPSVVRDEATRLATKFDFSTLVGTADLNNHIAMFQTAILEGKTVVDVAHSQGNFFANAAYDILYNGANPIPAKSFGIVSVANPASFVGGGGLYTTAAEDLVIQAIADATPPGVSPPLPPNSTNVGSGVATSDWLGHSFERAYMVLSSPTEQKIVGDITDTMSSLAVPVAIAQGGVITVTLTWGAQPDVDLHVFEPDGSHVFYQQLNGGSGHLDVDDTDGYGPEHYYVSCDMVRTGVYHVGVNYYRGQSPETATVQISAGGSVRTFEVPLSVARGSAGNQSPVPVADITVSGEVNTGYRFSITAANP
jgi:hypothetical protein